MPVKRSTAPVDLSEAPAPAPDPQVVVLTAAGPPAPQIGVACDKLTPGWLMGIGKAPETAAAHATRLGASAGKFNDVGYLLGTLEPRANWPAAPVVAAPAQQPAGQGTGTSP
jgi:hypothetical protein